MSRLRTYHGTSAGADQTTKIKLAATSLFPEANEIHSVLMNNNLNPAADLWVLVIAGGTLNVAATLAALDIQAVLPSLSGGLPSFMDMGESGLPTPTGFTVAIVDDISDDTVALSTVLVNPATQLGTFTFAVVSWG